MPAVSAPSPWRPGALPAVADPADSNLEDAIGADTRAPKRSARVYAECPVPCKA